MASTPFEQFLARADASSSNVNDGQNLTAELGRDRDLGDAFSDGMLQGAEGLGADVEYFKALFNTAIDNDTAAADNIRNARMREEFAASATKGMENFEQFLDEPTIEGALMQAFKFSGQAVPSLITAVGGGGVGGVAALVGKKVTTEVGKKAAKRIVTDSLKRTAKGIATPDEKALAQAAWGTFKKGAYTGAFSAEYVPLSGQNLSEALDSGKELDKGQAYRAAAIGVPQALIGVAGEAAILKMVGNVAKKRALKEGSTFGALAKEIGLNTLKGGSIEAATEVAQEGMAVANRFSLDDTYTRQDAQLRLAEAAFGGFMGGGPAAGGGTALVGGAQAIGESGVIEATAKVFDRARRMLDESREGQVNQEIDKEQYGDVMSGLTTPESQADLNAQLNAMVDDSSTKSAVWAAGDTPTYSARVNKATEVVVNGKKAFAAFIPGRGTIVAKSKAVVEEVIASKANDQSLSIALGYSASKSQVGKGDIIVQAIDKDGGVVSEELTDEAGYAVAVENAKGLAPEGGQVTETSVEKALEERNARFQKEPSVKAMDEDAFDSEETVEGSELDFEETVVGEFQSKPDPNQTFPNTEKARQDYIDTFGPTDFTDPAFSSITEATLKEAVSQQNSNPNAIVEVRKTDTGFQVVRQDYDALIRVVEDGQESRIPFSEFLPRAVAKAKKSKPAFKKVSVVNPDGKKSAVNLVDLTNAGKRLVEAREGTGFEGQTPYQAAQRGLQEILADLQIEGYDVQIGDQSFYDVGSSIPASMNVTAALIDGKKVGLKDLMAAPNTIETGKPDKSIAFKEDETGRTSTAKNNVAGTQTGTPEQLDAFEAFQQNLGNNTVRIEGEPDMDVEETIDGRSETERMADKPETAAEINSTIDRRRGAAPSTSSNDLSNGAIKGFLGGLVKSLLKAINLKNPPRVLEFAYLETKTEAELAELFPNEQERNNVIEAINMLKNKKSINGAYLKVANMILIRDTGNELNNALVLAHEVGHALFQEEMGNALANPAIRTRLEKGFKNAATYKSYLDAYGYELGFEEWYADQVARWAAKKYLNKQAKSLNEKHFKGVAARLKKLYRELSSNMRKRLGKLDTDFEAYVDAVVAAKKEGLSTSDPTFVQRALVQNINEVMLKEGGVALAEHWRAAIKKIARDPKLKPLVKIVRTADGVMRMYGGSKIADMFYVRSQSGKGGLGMLGASSRQIAEFQNKFEETVGTFDDPAVVAAFEEAASSKLTTELSPKAQQVRQFLDSIYDDYIAPSNTDINKQANYYPVVLDLLAIQNDEQRFIDLIMRENPEISEQQAKKTAAKLVKYNQTVVDDRPVKIDPASGVEQSIKLTRGIDREILKDAGFLQDPQEAFVAYLRHVVKRVEFNKATKDANGNSILDQEISELKKRDPEAAEMVKEIIDVYLGYQSKPLSPMWRKVNSYGQFLQFITILPFAAIASLPELAGPVINSKEFADLATGIKQIGATIKNRAEAKAFARDIGVVTNEVVANSWVTQAEQDFMDTKVRKMSDTFFRAIGLNWFTNFTREYAAGMGVQFITKHARNEFNNPKSERYLTELGLTAAEVNTWIKSGRKLSTPEGQKVKAGLQRFVESSILRPNAAERPIWASDPHWALVWQLKSYFYAYGKVIIGGIAREVGTRRAETKGALQITETMSVLAITALATMPLAMLAMEVREYAKQGLAWLLPGISPDNRYFRSDRMDYPTYLMEIIDRSGFLGVLTLGAMAHQNVEWDKGHIVPGALLPFAGPTIETIDTALENGFQIDRTLKSRILPIYNQL